MKALTNILFISLICLAGAVSLQAAEGADGWVSLFDGKTLAGWIQKNGTATYQVVDGTILGETSEGSPNSFLCTAKEYGDFELEFEVRVHDKLNSGVQIRSTTKKPEDAGQKYGRVNGPQVEIEASGSGGAEAGYIYGEATGRGWLIPEDKLIPHKHFRDGQWNKFRILVQGSHFKTWVNGTQVSDLVDEEIFKTHPKGFIGLQVHGIGKGTGPYDVAWRNIRIKE